MNRDFKQRIITISGVKNSGKTTLIEKLLKEFCADGLRVAVLKHDGHDFTCDIPGTDTYRFRLRVRTVQRSFQNTACLFIKSGLKKQRSL